MNMVRRPWAWLAVALTCAAARRLGEAERFVRAGRFRGWLPSPFMGYRLCGGTVGVIGAGRIGAAYARMMVEGFKMNLIYYNRGPRPQLEAQLAAIASATATNSELLRHVIGLLTHEDGGEGENQIAQIVEAIGALANSVDTMGKTVVAEIQKLTGDSPAAN